MSNRIRFALLALMVAISNPVLADGSPASGKRQTLYISRVVIEADMDKSSAEEVKYYTDLELEATIKVRDWFKNSGLKIVDSEQQLDDNGLMIKTTAVFNAGNRAVRWVGGLFGAGKATAKVTMEAIERGTEKVVSSKSAEDTMRMGGFGGSASKFLIGVVDTAWNELLPEISGEK